VDLVFNKRCKMKIIDVFFYLIYNFQTKRLGRNIEDAKYSSVLLLSAFISFFIIDIIILLGVVEDNKLSQFFHKGETFSFIVIGISMAILLCIRYYKCIDIHNIEYQIRLITASRLKVMKIIVVFIVFFTPILFLILCFIH
jgi:hypothetical protein